MMKKILIALAVCFMLAALTLLGLVCWIMAMLFSDSPAPLPRPAFKQEAFQSLCIKLAPLPSLIKNSSPGQTESIFLSAEEIDVLIILASYKDKAADIIFSGRVPDEMISKLPPLAFKDGSFVTGFNKPVGCWTPFGSCLNISASFSVDDKNPGNRIKVDYAKIGDIMIPSDISNAIVQSFDINGNRDNNSLAPSSASEKAIAEYMKKFDSAGTDGNIDFAKIVPEIKSGTSGITLKYYPYQLKLLIEAYIQDGPAKVIWKAL